MDSGASLITATATQTPPPQLRHRHHHTKTHAHLEAHGQRRAAPGLALPRRRNQLHAGLQRVGGIGVRNWMSWYHFKQRRRVYAPAPSQCGSALVCSSRSQWVDQHQEDTLHLPYASVHTHGCLLHHSNSCLPGPSATQQPQPSTPTHTHRQSVLLLPRKLLELPDQGVALGVVLGLAWRQKGCGRLLGERVRG